MSNRSFPDYFVVEHGQAVAQLHGTPLRPFAVYRSVDGQRLATFADRDRAERYATLASELNRAVAATVGGR